MRGMDAGWSGAGVDGSEEVQFSSVQFSRSVVSDSLLPYESQHARPPCPSPTPRVHSDSRPSRQRMRWLDGITDLEALCNILADLGHFINLCVCFCSNTILS